MEEMQNLHVQLGLSYLRTRRKLFMLTGNVFYEVPIIWLLVYGTNLS